MGFLSETLKNHGFEEATIKHIFAHYQNRKLGNLGTGIRKWIGYCTHKNREHQEIVWHNPSCVDVTNWLSSSEYGPGKSTTESTSRNYKRGLATLLTMVNNEQPSNLFPEITVDLVKMSETGRRAILNSSNGRSKSKTNRYDHNHFLYTHYIYDFYRSNRLDKTLSKNEQKKWLRMKALVLLRTDSMRRSGGISRIPMDSVKIPEDGKSLTFKIFMPKGAQQCISSGKATKRITKKGLSTPMTIYRTNNGNSDCCTVRAVVDYIKATEFDRKEAYTKKVTTKGSTTEPLGCASPAYKCIVQALFRQSPASPKNKQMITTCHSNSSTLK